MRSNTLMDTILVNRFTPVAGGIAGAMLIAGYTFLAFEFGRSVAATEAQPIYYCSEDSQLYISSGPYTAELTVAMVINSRSGALQGCDAPGEIVDRKGLTKD
jgi:hypothetical protein